MNIIMIYLFIIGQRQKRQNGKILIIMIIIIIIRKNNKKGNTTKQRRQAWQTRDNHDKAVDKRKSKYNTK